MHIEKLFLFSDTIRNALKRIKVFLLIVGRGLIILLRWNKRLSVTSLQINDSFLLTNGLLIIKWKVKNFLWVKINNKIFTTSTKGIMFNNDRVDQPMKIEVVGLFGRYEETFEIVPVATIQTQIIQPPLLKKNRLAIAEIKKSISQFTVDKIQFSFINTNFTTKIKSPDIILPTFKKDNYHE